MRLVMVSHRRRKKFAIDFLRTGLMHESERRTSRRRVPERVADMSGRSGIGNVSRQVVAAFCRHGRKRRCDGGGRIMN
jgi:hypothetical protein